MDKERLQCIESIGLVSSCKFWAGSDWGNISILMIKAFKIYCSRPSKYYLLSMLTLVLLRSSLHGESLK